MLRLSFSASCFDSRWRRFYALLLSAGAAVCAQQSPRFGSSCEVSHANRSIDAFEACLISAEMIRDPCARGSHCAARTGRGELYFKHMRKAGGSSLKSYISRQLCESALKLSPDWPKGFLRKGDALNAAGRVREAL